MQEDSAKKAKIFFRIYFIEQKARSFFMLLSEKKSNCARIACIGVSGSRYAVVGIIPAIADITIFNIFCNVI